jgi:exopolysaccharide biosynthesis polyprenyl glycosylphosphotransferase
VFSRRRRKLRFLFGLADVLLLLVAFEAAYRTRLDLTFEHIFYLLTPTKALLVGFIVPIWLLIAQWFGIYDRLESARPLLIVADSFRQAFVGGIAVVLYQYLLRLDLSRVFMALFACYAWLLIALFRVVATRVSGALRGSLTGPLHLMVLGTGERAQRLGETIERSASFGARLEGFISEDPDAASGVLRLTSEHHIHPLDQLPFLLRTRIIDEILVAVDSGRLPGIEDALLLCDEEGVRTRILVDFFPHVNSKIYLERLASHPMLTFSATPHDEILLMLKRVTDVVLAGVALVVMLPVFALVAILVRLTSPGPVIFRQLRCGLNGRRFTLYKFRSMCRDAEALKASVEHLNLRQTAFKIPRDPRLTPLGRWLRKFSVDEWPQLWNVLRGDMSLVGPRPAVPEEVEQYKRWQRRRLRMRPGLTCLWALAGRDSLDFETWMKLDMEYIDTWSLGLDWKILLRTVPHVLTGKGAH